VALLQMRVPPLPQLWAVLAAAPRGLRKAHSKTKTKITKTKGTATARHLVNFIQELCRVHLGIGALRSRSSHLPSSWRPHVMSTTDKLQLPGVLGDGVDIAGSYANSGLMAGLYQASNRLEDYMERLQPIRVGHIAMLKEDVLGKDKKQKSLLKQYRDTRTALDQVYSIGPERVEGLLEKASRIRHPRRLWQRRKSRRKLHLVEIWAAASSLSRAATLAADRMAAEA
ncbi:Metacaspase-1, partial [Durusdinium trenchii]